jgi:non-specific serine/threonine protein kinase
MGTVARKRHQATAPTNNLPRHLTQFIGRDAELRALKSLVGEARLVTVTGTGGAGKTRLAAELTRGSADRWPDGVWWIELAGADDVVGTVIATAELPGRGRPLDVVTSWLAERHSLLVLDNCEHLVEASAHFCQAVLEHCPYVTILATSREPLAMPGEARYPLTALSESEALQLFESRARLVRPGFSARPNAATIGRICGRLDRLPLAIEMASARLDMMSEHELLENLNDRFQVLESGARTVPERQQTMTAAIDWSYRLLSDDQARLFRRLAVFQGGFGMPAAQAVCAQGTQSALSLLGGLVQKSMVVAERSDSGTTRYRLLESHHDFATERLAESGELDEIQARHFDYYSAQKWQPAEAANFWHAASWAREHAADGGLGLAMAIADSDFSDQTRAKTLITELLERSQPSDTQRARALAMVTRLAWRLSDYATAERLAEESVAAARKLGDPDLIARALNGAGLVHESTGDLGLAGLAYDEALVLLHDSSDRQLVTDVSNSRALLAVQQGDPATALRTLQTCVDFARSQGNQELLARYLESLANAQLDLGDLDSAASSWHESLTTFRDVDDWFGIVWAMGGLALVAAARREDERALRLGAAAERLSRQYSFAVWRFRADQLGAAFRQARSRLGSKGRGDAAWSQGEAMTTSEALAYALTGEQAAKPEQVDVGPLSRREREVAKMVAAGMTNREIAQRLFIAERTAEGHVERIRNKLGVRSRTEVATWAVAHGLGPGPLDKPPPASKV